MPFTGNEIAITKHMEDTADSMLSYYETKISETKKILFDFKRKATFLRRKIKDNNLGDINAYSLSLTNIIWRNEIRNWFKVSNAKHQFYLATTNEIVSCLAYRKGLKINRDIKVKISTSLSSMFQEGKIGRVTGQSGRNHLYGYKRVF